MSTIEIITCPVCCLIIFQDGWGEKCFKCKSKLEFQKVPAVDAFKCNKCGGISTINKNCLICNISCRPYIIPEKCKQMVELFEQLNEKTGRINKIFPDTFGMYPVNNNE